MQKNETWRKGHKKTPSHVISGLSDRKISRPPPNPDSVGVSAVLLEQTDCFFKVQFLPPILSVLSGEKYIYRSPPP